MRTRKAKWLKGETISVSIGQGAFTASPLQLALATAITANQGSRVTPHVLRETRGTKTYHVHNGTNGKIQFNGTPEDWIKMREAMVDVIQTGTGKGIRSGLSYHIAGKTGTAQVKSIAQGKRYNESLLTERQLDHGLFVGFAPAENPEIAIAVVGKMAVMVVPLHSSPAPFSITGWSKEKSDPPKCTPDQRWLDDCRY